MNTPVLYYASSLRYYIPNNNKKWGGHVGRI